MILFYPIFYLAHVLCMQKAYTWRASKKVANFNFCFNVKVFLSKKEERGTDKVISGPIIMIQEWWRHLVPSMYRVPVTSSHYDCTRPPRFLRKARLLKMHLKSLPFAETLLLVCWWNPGVWYMVCLRPLSLQRHITNGRFLDQKIEEESGQ